MKEQEEELFIDGLSAYCNKKDKKPKHNTPYLLLAVLPVLFISILIGITVYIYLFSNGYTAI